MKKNCNNENNKCEENNIETVNNLSDSAKIHEAKALLLLEKQKDALSTLLTQLPDANEWLVIIKNIELFDEQFISQFITMKNIILSGNFQKAEYIQQQFRSEINTSILFSPLPNQKFPHVKQYSGYLSSGRGNGVVSIKQE